MSTLKKHATAETQIKKADTVDSSIEKRARNQLICYRYAQLRNAAMTAREFGTNRMYVTRLWDRLSEEDRDAILDTSKEVSEDLNKRIIEAERVAGDGFVTNVVKAREMAGKELLRRFTGRDIRMISNKDFASLVRLVSDIVTGDDPNKSTTNTTNTFRTHRESISKEINNFKK